MSAERILASQGYKNIAAIGKGSFGTVYSCTSACGENLAVKISFNPEARLAAQREASVMSRMPNHPNVLPLVAYSDTQTHTMLATPLATGGDTLKFMQERSCLPLAETEVRGLFAQLVDAVDHMHSNGFTHRDIKCENVLLTGARRRTVVLADFGFSAHMQLGERLIESWGSLLYSSPEICAKVPYEGTKVDIWSMGVVLFAWATGRLPFGGNTEQETAVRIIGGVYSVPSSCGEDLSELISGMLCTDSKKRLTIDGIRKSVWMATAPASPTSGLSSSMMRSSSNVYPAPAPAIVANDARRASSPDIKPPARLSSAGGLLRSIFHRP